MNFLSNVVGYSGKLFFATVMFFAMIISTVVSLPFIGAGMIKDATGVWTGGPYPCRRYKLNHRFWPGRCLRIG